MLVRILRIASKSVRINAHYRYDSRRSIGEPLSLVNFAVLAKFKELYGHLRIPFNYIVGENSKAHWPQHLIGFKLGTYVSFLRKSIQNKSLSSDVVDRLTEMGFSLNLRYVPNFSLFLIYKSIYGHLHIPVSYRIGMDGYDDKWPPLVRGQPLGIFAQSIRKGLKRKAFSPEIVQQLQDMEFPFSDAVMIKIEVLQAFKSLYGHVQVPKKFVIPPYSPNSPWPKDLHGFKLGLYVRNLTRRLREKTVGEGSLILLQEVGVPMSHQEYRHHLLVECCKAFVQKYGHGRVPGQFVIPKGDKLWPQECWGEPLGMAVKHVRYFISDVDGQPSPVRAQLEEAGIDFSPRELLFERFFAALLAYKQIYNSVRVPVEYVVPMNDERYPSECWGFRLGGWLHEIRIGLYYQDQKKKLQDIGVRFKTKISFEMKYAALQSYKSLHNHLDIPLKYVIKEGDENYNPVMWGFKLGSLLDSIKRGKSFKDNEQIQALGIVPYATEEKESKPKQTHFKYLYAALLAYKKVNNGSVNVPHDFVIPAKDKRYPKDMWGFSLGRRLRWACLHGRKIPIYTEKLMSLGVKFGALHKKTDFETVYAALVAYKNLHGHVKVPQKFVIDDQDANYDPEAWGMSLGRILHHARSGKSHTQHKQALLDLGVVFLTGDEYEKRFDTVCATVRMYKQFNEGPVKVSARYRIPLDDERYPEEMRGYKLGEKLRHILKDKDEDRKEKLKALLES